MADPVNHFQFARDNVNLEGFDPEYFDRLNALSRDIEALTGRPLQVTSGFRTNEEQKVLYDNFKAGKSKYPAAAPGKSRHNVAGAIDADSSQLNAAANAGLLDKHGFHRPVKNDPVHLELKKMAAQTTQAPAPAPAPVANQQSLPPMEGVAAAIEQNNLGIQALKKLNDTVNNTYAQVNNIMRGSASDAALVALSKETAELGAQRQTLEFANQIGTNPDAANFALANLMQQSVALAEKERAVSERIAFANDPKQMFSQPMRWVADYLLEPNNQKRQAAIRTQIDSTNRQIKSLVDTTSDVKLTANNIAQTKNAQSVAAATNLASGEWTLKQAQAQIDQARYNSDNVSKTTDMSNTALSIQFRVRDQLLQEQRDELARSDQLMRGQILQKQLADANTADAARRSFFQFVTAGSDNLGLPKFGSAEELDLYLKANPQYQSSVAIAYNNGYAQANGLTPTVAGTPVEALKFVTSSGANMDAGRAQLMKRVQVLAAEVGTDAGTREAAAKKETHAVTVNKGVIDKFTEAHKDITKRPDVNPYKAPPLESLMADPHIASTYWGKTVLAPLLQAGTTELPFTRAIDLLLADVKAGKVSMAEASQDLVFVGTKIKALNNDVYRYYATAGVPNQKAVNVPVNVPKSGFMGYLSGAFDTAVNNVSPISPGISTSTELKKMDISDPVAVDALMNKIAATNLKKPPPSASGKVGVE